MYFNHGFVDGEFVGGKRNGKAVLDSEVDPGDMLKFEIGGYLGLAVEFKIRKGQHKAEFLIHPPQFIGLHRGFEGFLTAFPAIGLCALGSHM